MFAVAVSTAIIVSSIPFGVAIAKQGPQFEFDWLAVINDFYLDRNLIWNGVTIDAVNTGDAHKRSWFRGDGEWGGVGLAAACHDVLDSTISTMSNVAWETLISCTVDIPEATDRVLASVTGQFRWEGTTIFVAILRDICAIPDPTTTIPLTSALLSATCETVSSQVGQIQGMTTRDTGGLYVLGGASGRQLICAIPDPTRPTFNVTCEQLGTIFYTPVGITRREEGGVYIADGKQFNTDTHELCEVPDPTAPTIDAICRGIAQVVGYPSGITTRDAGGVYIISTANDLCVIPDPARPDINVTCQDLPIGETGARGVAQRSAGGVYVAFDQSPTDRLCIIPDPMEASFGVCLDIPDGSGQLGGATEAGSEGECMIRIARGGTSIETLMIDSGRILLDTTFVDQGASGLTTYTVDMMTANPYTLCSAVKGNRLGTIPLPSLLVQVFFGE